ncbi:MAG: DUF488 domain-containing protein [bacterium]
MKIAEMTVYSVGTGGRPWEIFVQLLRNQDIRLVADVRSRPVSSVPHFRQTELRDALLGIDLQYIFLGKELGGYQRGGYETHMATKTFAAGMDRLESLAQSARTAFLCAETLPWKCHRWHIATELENRGWQVLHLISPGKVWNRSQVSEENLLWTTEP